MFTNFINAKIVKKQKLSNNVLNFSMNKKIVSKENHLSLLTFGQWLMANS